MATGPQFRSLFNGKDLTGWCFRAKVDRKAPRIGDVVEKFDGKTQSSDAGRYSAKDGILTVNFPKGQERLIAQLYTVEEFPKDFVLKLEFRASVNAESAAPSAWRGTAARWNIGVFRSRCRENMSVQKGTLSCYED